MRSAGGPLAVVLRQRRLGVERIDVRRAAVHEQEDDPLGPRREVRRLRRQRIAAARPRCGRAGRRRPARSPAPARRSRRRSGAALRGESMAEVASTICLVIGRSAARHGLAAIASIHKHKLIRAQAAPGHTAPSGVSAASSAASPASLLRNVEPELAPPRPAPAGRRAAGTPGECGSASSSSGFVQPGGQRLGLSDHELAVEHEQLLQRHRRHRPALAGDVRVGEIEQPQQAVRGRAG